MLVWKRTGSSIVYQDELLPVCCFILWNNFIHVSLSLEIKNIKKQISQNIQKKLSAFSGISSIIVRRKTRMEDLRWT